MVRWTGKEVLPLIQRFIELGEGYGDVFELCELTRLNRNRIHHAFIFTSKKEDKEYFSIAVALNQLITPIFSQYIYAEKEYQKRNWYLKGFPYLKRR